LKPAVLAARDLRFFGQPNNPSVPRPVASSGRAAGTGGQASRMYRKAKLLDLLDRGPYERSPLNNKINLQQTKKPQPALDLAEAEFSPQGMSRLLAQ